MNHIRCHIMVCAGTGCTSSESPKIIDAFERELKAAGVDSEAKVVKTYKSSELAALKTTGTVGYQYFYADLSGNSYGTSSMQREHVWPQSKASYFQLNGGADLHHLRPSIGGVNQSKSNRAFADLIGTDTAYSSYQVDGQDVIWNGTKSFDNVLEVRDNVKALYVCPLAAAESLFRRCICESARIRFGR